jgi:HEPN domain-containing protein
MACLVADGFFNAADRFFSKLPRGLNKSAQAAFERRGELAAAATSLALAIELYLKALAIGFGKRPVKTHDLTKLFGELPSKLQNSIEAAYANFSVNMPQDVISAIEMFVTTTPYPPTETEETALRRQVGDCKTVRSLLENEKDAFQNWRYVYEPDMPSGVSFIQIEFHRLGAVAKILRANLVSGTRG